MGRAPNPDGRAVRSYFTYPRSLVRDVAATLASVRQMVPAAHLYVLDRVIEELADTFDQHDTSFDAETFHMRSDYHQGRDDGDI